MNAGPSDERLSAYLDREATPTERDAVENLLEASPDARAELEAFSELSQILKTLPHQSAPVDFSQRVMHRIAATATTAIPAGSAALPQPLPPKVSVTLSEPPVRKSYRREWLSAFAGAVVSAATLLLAFGPQANRVTQISTAVQPEMFGSRGGTDFAPVVMSDADTDGLRGIDGTVTDRYRLKNAREEQSPQYRRLASADDHLKRRDVAKLEVDAQTKFAAAAPEPDAMDRRPAEAAKEIADSHSPQIPLSDFLANWTTLDVNGQYVANVDLEVVDVERSADMLQVLLVRNGVAKVTNTWEVSSESRGTLEKNPGSRVALSDHSGADKKQPDAAADDSGLIAVYVESDQLPLLKSLEQLSENNMVLRTRLQPPLPYFDSPAIAADENRFVDSTTKDKRNNALALAEQETLQRKVTNVARAYNSLQYGVELELSESGLAQAVDAPVSALDAWNDETWRMWAMTPGHQNGRAMAAAMAPKPAAVERSVAASGALLPELQSNGGITNSFNTKIVLSNTTQFNELKSRMEPQGKQTPSPLGAAPFENGSTAGRFPAPPLPMTVAPGNTSDPSLGLNRERPVLRKSGAYGNTTFNYDAARQQSSNTIRVLFVMVPGKQTAPTTRPSP